jgi:ribose/xylose/arabinose/galactoside ABC-type transport system permease subunit
MAAKKFELFLLDNMIWFINLVLVIIFVSIEPGLLTPKNLISMIYSVSMLGLLVFAQAIVLISGNFDLSVGAIAGISMTVVAVIHEFGAPGTPWYVLLLIMLVIGAGVGLYNGFFISVLKINPFLQTLGTYTFFYGFMLIIGKRTLFKIPPQLVIPGGGKFGNTILPVAVVILIVISVLVHILLAKTSMGRKIYAVGSNREAARACGISVERTLIWVFVLSGLLSAVGGLLYAGYMNCVTMDLARPDLFLTFAGAIIGGVALDGGRGKVSGIFGGILLLGIMQIGLTILKTPATWRETMNGIVLIAAILLNTYQTKLKGYVLAKSAQ